MRDDTAPSRRQYRSRYRAGRSTSPPIRIPSETRQLPKQLVTDLEKLGSDLGLYCNFQPHKDYRNTYTCNVNGRTILWTMNTSGPYVTVTVTMNTDDTRRWYVDDITNETPSEQEIKDMLLAHAAHSRSESQLPSPRDMLFPMED